MLPFHCLNLNQSAYRFKIRCSVLAERADKIGGKGFGIEPGYGEKSRDAVDLGVAEIPDIRERNG